MKKILVSLSVIAFVGAAVAGATGAWFSDTETSTGNTFTAGAIDLKIDNHGWYNGLECTLTGVWADPQYHWSHLDGTTLLSGGLDEPLGNSYGNDPHMFSLIGKPCNMTWPVELGDLDAGQPNKFLFHLSDLKPGDWEEDTISVHVDNNDAWACASFTLTSDADNNCTEPEDADDGNCAITDTNQAKTDEGELADNLEVIWWADDGDNVLENDEHVIQNGIVGYAQVGYSVLVKLADSLTNIWGSGPLVGARTYYIGKAFCFGDLNPVPYPGQINQVDDNTGPSVRPVLCNGSSVNNASQTDSLTADVSFYAVQSRNNPSYTCKLSDFPTQAP